MTTLESVSNEQIAVIMDPKWVQKLAGRIVVDVCEIERDSPEDDPMACVVYAPELDAIVEHRLTQALGQIHAALSSLHAQPEGEPTVCACCGTPFNIDGPYCPCVYTHRDWKKNTGERPHLVTNYGLSKPQQTGSREAVAWRSTIGGVSLSSDPFPNAEPLVPLSQLQAVERENERLNTLNADLIMQARGHAQEARTANGTIYEIYQAISGGKGEPGNWNGAQPVRDYIATAGASLAAAREALINISELNLTGEDENGHKWANSDLIDQEIRAALAGSNPK